MCLYLCEASPLRFNTRGHVYTMLEPGLPWAMAEVMNLFNVPELVERMLGIDGGGSAPR